MHLKTSFIRPLTLGAVLLLVLLLMMPNLIWYAYEPNLQTAIEALLIPGVLLLTLFAVLGNIPWLACLLLAPFVLLAPMEIYYVSIYHHPTSAEIIGTLVASNPRETREYFGAALVPMGLGLLAALTLVLLTTWWSSQLHLHWRGRVREWVLILVTAIPLTSMAVVMMQATGGLQQRVQSATNLAATFNDSIEPGYPFGVLQRIDAYQREWAAMRSNASRLDTFHFHATRITQLHQRQVYVLVIGESSRRNHWQLFGYSRPTNPELSKVSNLVTIGNMVTSWPESLQAIPLVITRKPMTDGNPTFNEASILRAMQEADYETYWISNQLAIGKFDSPVSSYAYEAQHVEWLNHASWAAPGSYDGDLLRPLREALTGSTGDLFIVLHMMGSHAKYDFRYPASFKHFRPTQTDAAGSASSIVRQQNSYDNTILYSDHVLASAIDILRHSGAMTALWYESDHGEMLQTPTCSFSGHGLGTRYEFEVPAFFWYSNAYGQQFPERVATLVGHSRDRTLSANTFESLIDMAGVEFSSHDESWSLFSHYWQYRPRIVNSYWQSNFDKADFGKNCPLMLPQPPLDAHQRTILPTDAGVLPTPMQSSGNK